MPERFLYTPTEYVERGIRTPLIFLAGPIQGAPDWQSKAVEIIHLANPEIIIASPRRNYLSDDYKFEQQADWETYHLEQAGGNGVIMFWLPNEIERIPDREYAQTTRVEFGVWITEHKYRETKMAIGIEPGFPGARYFRYKAEPYPEIPILETLEQTCQATLDLITI